MNIETVREVLAIDALGYAVRALGRLMPYLLVVAAFTFVYMFIPNAKVRIRSALIGGAVGGIAWQSAGWVFAVFVVSSNKYAAIYSSFAVLVLFMIWLYLSWLILLVGASVAFYAQHPEYLFAKGGEPRLSNRMRERVALSAMTLVAQRFVTGERAPAQAEFTQALGVPMHALQAVLDSLEGAGLIAQSAEEPARYLPCRDPSLVSVSQVLAAVRSAGEEDFLAPEAMPVPQSVDRVLDEIRQVVDGSVGETTLRDLASQRGATDGGELAR
jgi:membrane protein